MDNLEEIFEEIQRYFEEKNAARERVLATSRRLVRFSANAIRAVHRGEFDAAGELLEKAEEEAAAMKQDTASYRDLYHAGYTQDALKELVEANLTLAMVRGEDLPTPAELEVEIAAYINGLAEAASELRRYALDALRSGDVATGERMLSLMDEVYGMLVTIDFPDALTGGIRRQTDMLRGVLERTRGDVTTAVRQERMHRALRRFEGQIGEEGDPGER